MSRPRLMLSDHKPASVDSECFQQVINGSLAPSNTPSVATNPASTTVRVYLHSDCIDCHYERDKIWQEVIPEVSSFARSIGLAFHFIDPYHLLSAHGTTSDLSNMAHLLELEGVYELNMKEILTCQDKSAGLSFMTLLGQKYGHRLLKTEIEKGDFDLLSATVEDASMKSALRNRYILNKATIPQKYILKGPNHMSDSWIKEHDELAKTIKKAAKVAFGKDPIKVQNYTLSVNEEEIAQGIFNCPSDVNQSCVWFKRQFTDLYDQRPSSDPSLSLYSDVCIGRREIMEFDSEAVKLLNYLKEARMPARYIGLDSTNIFDFSIKWHKNQGLSPNEEEEHSSYLSSLSAKLTEYLKDSLTSTSDKVESDLGCTCYQECLLHAKHCRGLLKDVKDRPMITEAVTKYLHESSCQSKPLVLYGPSGGGKSTMMASAVKLISDEGTGHSRCSVFRFIGETAVSRNIRSLLESICQQIALVYGYAGGSIPADYSGLINLFHYLISTFPSPDKPMYILLDGLDNLLQDNQGLSLAWLPVELPPYVQMIVSVPSEVDCRCHLILRSVIDSDTCFVKVPSFNLSEAETFLEYFLSLKSLKITSTHMFLLSDALKMAGEECSSTLTPLYLQTIAFITKHFSTSLSKHQDQLLNLSSAINLLFDNVEQAHGKAFVSLILSLITTSQFGMAENELLDILSCDSNVLAEIQSRCANLPIADSIAQVPQIVWSSFLHLLYPSFLCYRMAMGGAWVLQWTNRGVRDIVAQRYQQTSQTIVNYFSGKMADERMNEQKSLISQQPSKSENKAEDANGSEAMNEDKHETTVHHKAADVPRPLLIRPISGQELQYGGDVYNVRKMTELPYAIHQAKQYSLLAELAFDYHFLRANAEMQLLDNVLSYLSFLCDPLIDIDYDGADPAASSTKNEVRLLQTALSLSIDNLTRNPSQLSMELLGRLLTHAMDSPDKPRISDLLVQAVSKDLPHLIPLQSYSRFPRENHLLSMNGHLKAITQVDSTIVRVSGEHSDDVHEEMIIVSSSMDGKLRSWDWHGSGTLKTFNGHSGAVWCVALAKNGEYMVSGGEDRTVRFWCVADATCLHVLKGHKDSIKGVCITRMSTKVISASLDSSIKVWNTDQSSSCKGQLMFTLNPSRMMVMANPKNAAAKSASTPVHCICLCKDDTELVCGLGNGFIVIVNILAGEIVRSFKGSPVSMGTVSSVAIAQLNDRRVVIAVTDDSAHLCCYDTGEHIGSKPCSFSSIYGKLASRNQSDILSRIPESLLHDSSITTFTYANLGAHGITGSEDGTLRVWDLEKPETFKPMTLDGSVCAIAYSQCGKYISTAYENGCGTVSTRSGRVPVIIIWQLNDLMKPYASLELTNQITVTHLEFYKSNRLISSHNDGVVRIWNIETKQIEEEFSNARSEQGEYLDAGSDGVTCFGISSDRKVLLVGTKHGDISIWNMEKKSKLSRKLEGHAHHSIVSILFTHQFIITADKSGRVIVREYKTLKIVNELVESDNNAELNCLEVGHGQDMVNGPHPCQRLLLVGAYSDGSVKIWLVSSLQKVFEFTVQYGPVSSVGFLQDKIITTSLNGANDSGCIQVWEDDICIGMGVTDSAITTATIKPIESHDGLIMCGCKDGHTGVYLYDTHAKSDRKDHVMKALLMEQRPKSANLLLEEVCGNGLRKSKTSQTTLHSVKEVVQEDDVIIPHNEDSSPVVVNSTDIVSSSDRQEGVDNKESRKGVVDEKQEGVVNDSEAKSHEQEGIANDRNEPSVQTSSCTLF